MASQMVFSGTAGCPAFNPNPWKADICQVDDDDDDGDKGCGFQLHLKADICQVDADDDDDDKGVDLKSDICKVDLYIIGAVCLSVCDEKADFLSYLFCHGGW